MEMIRNYECMPNLMIYKTKDLCRQLKSGQQDGLNWYNQYQTSDYISF